MEPAAPVCMNTIARLNVAYGADLVSKIRIAEGESPEEGDSPVLKNWIKSVRCP